MLDQGQEDPVAVIFTDATNIAINQEHPYHIISVYAFIHRLSYLVGTFIISTS